MAVVGNGFTDFNPFNIKGVEPPGISLLFDTLTKPSADEISTEYGLVADKVIWDDGKKWVAYTIKENAKFSDGSPITADDIIFSFNILREKGNPFYSSYYKDVADVQKLGARHVKFNFKNANNELALIIGQMPVLSRSYWSGRDFEKTGFDIPVSSGAYKIKSYDATKNIVYERDENYWGARENVNAGYNNFATIQYDYYRDTGVALEAFKAGEYDLRTEMEAKKWAVGYDRKNPKIVMREFHHSMPSGMQGFVFNLDKPVFKSKNIRRAIGNVFDFEWTNRKLFYSAYSPTRSYFDNSVLSSHCKKISDAELKILSDFNLPKDFYEWKNCDVNDENGEKNIRERIKESLDVLYAHGYEIDPENLLLKHQKTGESINFEILLSSGNVGVWERVVLPFIANLRKIGINAELKIIEANIFKTRLDNYDYDMVVGVFPMSISPGNEQEYYFGSAHADAPGGYNYARVRDDVVDGLINGIVAARNFADLQNWVRAYDRILLWNYFVIPNWYIPYNRVAYWDKFDFVSPEKSGMLRGQDFMTWWVKE